MRGLVQRSRVNAADLDEIEVNAVPDSDAMIVGQCVQCAGH